MPYRAVDPVTTNIRTWEPAGQPFEAGVLQQVYNIAKLPVVERVCLMPDGHQGIGGPVGGVIATRKAVIPALVGVDIGCGMMAVETSLLPAQLDGRLPAIRAQIESAVPVGGPGVKGSWPLTPEFVDEEWYDNHERRYRDILAKHPGIHGKGHPAAQLGTLGTGNHFIEVCVGDRKGWEDEKGVSVWVVLHSGSRGVGNRIGTYFIERAKEHTHQNVPDRDLHWLDDGTPVFRDYLEAVTWAQRYASANRRLMMRTVLNALKTITGDFVPLSQAVNCHHNYVEQTAPWDYVTRKGAVDASFGMLGIIPGSMGAKSFIVRGLGNPDSLRSCSHGVGRRMSRGVAKRTITVDDHALATLGVECRKDAGVLDESPAAYKDIDAVMAAQADLVEIVATLKQVVCVKG